jgi:hypothetical protein
MEIKSVTPIVPGKGRPSDKAVACAKTYDLRYMLRVLLLLPQVEEEIEPDTRDDTKFDPTKKKTRKPKTTKFVPPDNGAEDDTPTLGVQEKKE